MGPITLRTFLETDIPEGLRAEFALLAAEYLRSQSRLLFTGFILSLPMVILGRVQSAPLWVGVGLPLAVLVLSVTGLILVRDRPLRPDAAVALLRHAWLACLGVAAIGSLWGVASWIYAPAETRVYYVAVLSLGSLTMGYTLTATRLIGSSAICVALLPISAALLLVGDVLDAMLGVGLLIAVAFQVMLISRQQRLMLDLVEERNRSRLLARTDPLTGLANRRALLEAAERLGAGGTPLRLVLVDLDRFKRINDDYGHDTGDEVLMIVATLLADHADGEVVAARLGGEEFALLGAADALAASDAEAVLTAIREAEMPHGDKLTASCGVGVGSVCGVGHWSDLYGNADTALYAAKRGGRDRVVEWSAREDFETRPGLALSSR